VQEGSYGEVLLEVADRLCAELAYSETGKAPGARSTLAEEGVMAQILSPKEESLVTGIREGLAKIAAAVAGRSDRSNIRAVLAALDGVEMVVRGELMNGNEDQLPRLMPSFVFLVALPTAGQNRAIELSKRTAALVQEEIKRSDPL